MKFMLSLLLLLASYSRAEMAKIPLAGSLPEEESIFSETNLVAEIQRMGALLEEHGRRHLQASTLEEYNALNEICRGIEATFYQNVTCSCVGALKSDTFSMTCMYNEEICGPLDSVCGKPELGMTLLKGGIYSATACVHDYVNKRRAVEYENTCILVEMCDNDVSKGICGCNVQYGTGICQTCQVCDDKQSIQLDCTNINAEAVSTECRKVDMDLDLAGGAGVITGFLPDFGGFCSQLEEGRDGKVSCDCSNSGGGNYDVTCETIEPECVGDVCAHVSSTISVVEGTMERVKSCSNLEQPYDFREVCTTLTLCNKDVGDETICGCFATYWGDTCNSCDIGEDGLSIKVDCSNLDESAYTSDFQKVRSTTSYDFFPAFAKLPAHPESEKTQSSALSLCYSVAAAVLIFSFLFAY